MTVETYHYTKCWLNVTDCQRSQKKARSADSGGQRRVTVCIWTSCHMTVCAVCHGGHGLDALFLIKQSGRWEGYMKIEVNQTSPILWGKLGIQETRAAAEKLSGVGFKTWVMLSLNQDGYVWSGDLEPHTIQELVDYGYLYPLNDGDYVFLPDGDAGEYDIPAEWGKIAGLYRSNKQQDLYYIKGKLDAVGLADKIGSILVYWIEKYDALQWIDHSKARNHLRFDFSVLLIWWMWDNFTFEVGDVLEFGEDAHTLRFHDDECKSFIVSGVQKRKITKLEMQPDILPYWNRIFAERKFEMPLNVVGKILKSRRQ